MRCDRLWRNARLATLAPSAEGLGEVARGVVASRGGEIAYAGHAASAPSFEPVEEIDCEGRWITPALIDPHTHLVFAGDRAQEFERRLAGATYEEIARSGGGIASTMVATRAANEDELVASALPRLDALIDEGVATVEIKSGYGLNLEAELKCLRAIARLARERPVTINATLLAAHAVPPEFAGDPDGYVDLVCREMIPRVASEGLATAVDAFCETIGFSPDQVARVFAAAQASNLAVKLHAEQLSNQGGAALAARFHALSADHLEYLDDAGVTAMAAAGTTAVLLPGAFYFTREAQLPPIAGLRAAKVPMALATDCNPGTSPLTSLLLTMNLAATLFRLSVDECLAAVTREAARALGMADRLGTLEAGKTCDLAIWEIERPAELVWRMGFNPIWRRVWRGQ